MPDYADCYATLGVTPETDRKALRAGYKRLIGQWHPDRFSDDPALREIAEERSKRITLAYQTLENYRRHHGVLPQIVPAAEPEDARESKHATESDRPSVESRIEPRKTRGPARGFPQPEPARWRRLTIASSVLFVAIYLSYLSHDLLTPDDIRSETPASTGLARPAPEPGPGITTGSTLGEVYSIQGIPTSTDGETWYYGKSKIRFAQGKVVSWSEHPDDPLRITGDPFARSQERLFDVGSTKDEVRAVQGTPVSETDAVWDYAPSRVYFENNKVVRWQESPMQPLRVPR